jgi:FMNH2-dependent dimethyl sulfone monooxygenase
MKLGVSLQGASLTPKFEDIKRIALKADELGFDSIWVSDHLMHPFSVDGMPMHYCHEAWTVMTALAALTNRVRVGFSVLNPGFRYPSVLAKMAASLDEISSGRLIMSLGAGWLRKEYDAYGIPWVEHDSLIEREREAALVMKALLTQTVASFSGKYYHLEGAVMEPKPLQKPHPPIWIGGNSPKTMEVAAELGDGWFTAHVTPEELKDKITSMRRTIGDRPMEYATTFGKPSSYNTDETIDKIRRYANAGVSLLTMHFDTKTLETFAKNILPNI